MSESFSSDLQHQWDDFLCVQFVKMKGVKPSKHVISNKRNKSLGVPVAASVTKSNKLSTFVIFLLWNFRICAVKKALIFKSDHFLILAVGLFHLYEVITNICMLPAPFMSLYFLWQFFLFVPLSCHLHVLLDWCHFFIIYFSLIFSP